jgi:hypothetical protein
MIEAPWLVNGGHGASLITSPGGVGWLVNAQTVVMCTCVPPPPPPRLSPRMSSPATASSGLTPPPPLPPPIGAPCTQCLRHGDPLHAKERLTAATAAQLRGAVRPCRRVLRGLIVGGPPPRRRRCCCG